MTFPGPTLLGPYEAAALADAAASRCGGGTVVVVRGVGPSSRRRGQQL